MILQDNLYTIVSQQEQEGVATFQLSLHPEWPIYKAHFPGHPITPGVCIVQMVQELLQVLQNRELCLRQAKNVKYVAITQDRAATGRQPEGTGTGRQRQHNLHQALGNLRLNPQREGKSPIGPMRPISPISPISPIGLISPISPINQIAPCESSSAGGYCFLPLWGG